MQGIAGKQLPSSISQPLAGVRILEFAHVAAGPFAGSLLADLGADVVKVEPPDGDQMRSWPPFAENDDIRFSHNFAAMNRNKRSIVANLKDPAEVKRVKALAAQADVVVENYRVGTLDRLGFGFEELSANHKGLVYCSISGFGRNSPYRQRGAYDVVIQAMGGLMSVTGETDGPPVKSGVPVADFIAGLYGALAISATLPRVRDSGESIHVDVPMLDCLLGTSALQTSEYWGNLSDPMRLGSAHPRNAPYQSFRTADREIVIAAGSQKLWREVCAVLELDDLINDDRFADQSARVNNQLELAKIIEDRLQSKCAVEWLADLEAAGVPVSLVNTYGDVLHDPHVQQGELLVDVEVPVAGTTPMTRFPARIGTRPRNRYAAPPLLGEHTEEVIEQWLNNLN